MKIKNFAFWTIIFILSRAVAQDNQVLPEMPMPPENSVETTETVQTEEIPEVKETAEIKEEAKTESIQLNNTAQSKESEAKTTFLKGRRTSIKDPFELRDPFKRELGKRRAADKKIGSVFKKKDDTFTNISDISNVPLENIKIVGVMLGGERRAMARIKTDGKDSEETIILKEGMLLGVDKAELKAILPGGIVLVEKIKNVYDETEYLETVIPVSPE